ncbi:MAG: 50S ribosomal protein L21 [Chloroflexi bacterium]|nr:50S ribosomal protein L21 [Chloroflexota bacterium]
MYAVIESGSKQYKVTVGAIVDVELLDVKVGDVLQLDRVCLVADDANVQIGKPVLENARVSATVLGHGQAAKVIIFKHRAKERYRRKTGHRQGFTRLRIDAISA